MSQFADRLDGKRQAKQRQLINAGLTSIFKWKVSPVDGVTTVVIRYGSHRIQCFKFNQDKDIRYLLFAGILSTFEEAIFMRCS